MTHASNADPFFPHPTHGAAEAAMDSRHLLLKEIGLRWQAFSDAQLSNLTSREDLVRAIASRYELDAVQAERDVDTLLKGRTF